MSTQKAAQLFGIIFILVGLLGLVTGGTGMSEHMMLGLFPVNLLHNCVHLAIGVWGVMAAKNQAGATTFCQVGGVLYLVLGVLGFLTANPMGLVPIGGNDRWLHLALGVILSYVGFAGSKATAAA